VPYEGTHHRNVSGSSIFVRKLDRRSPECLSDFFRRVGAAQGDLGGGLRVDTLPFDVMRPNG
jgi:hypothetical protein